MKLRDLMNDVALIHDDTPIRVVTPTAAGVRKVRGMWYNDQILEHMNSNLSSFVWSKGKGVTVTIEQGGQTA